MRWLNIITAGILSYPFLAGGEKKWRKLGKMRGNRFANHARNGKGRKRRGGVLGRGKMRLRCIHFSRIFRGRHFIKMKERVKRWGRMIYGRGRKWRRREGMIWKREWEREFIKKEKIVKERWRKNGEEGKDEEGEEEILNWQDIKVCFVRTKRESGPAWPVFTPEMLRAVSSLKLVEPKKRRGNVSFHNYRVDLELKFNDSSTASTWCLWINRNTRSKLYRNFPDFIKIKLRMYDTR